MALEDRIRLPALNLIHRRQRLLNKLAEFVEAKHRLITVYAPGGYGKSILLADFALTIDLPVCWCSLDTADRDPTVFLTLLTHSITNRFFQIDSQPLFSIVQQGDTQSSIHRITTSLENVGPHLIILDDYHKAVSAGMTVALNRLLEQLPETSTLIVAARGDMRLETSQVIELLITEKATGLSEEELRFTPVELQRVIRKRFGREIDFSNAQTLAQATDGNIAQILLTGHLMHANNLAGRLQQSLGDDQTVIYGYLAKEVFDKLPPDIQQFLLYTSVLPDITAEICNDLLDITNAQEQLQALIRRDLFINQIGGGFRYHDLFGEFLRSKLAEDDALYRRVSIKAGDILARQGRFEEAIYLYLSVQAWDKTVDLLEIQGRLFYTTGRALTLNNWLAEIPEEELLQRPRLLLLRGQILNYDLGESEQAMMFFRQAEDKFREQADLIGAAEAQVWQSIGLRMAGQADEGLKLAATGLQQLEKLHADHWIMAWAIKNRGTAHGTAGKISEALADLRQALNLFELLEDVYNVGSCHHNMGRCLEAQGNINGANYHYRQAIRIWEMSGNANDLANTLNNLGVTLQMIGQDEEALQQFNQSLDIALQIGAARRAAFALAGIGDIYLRGRNYGEAVAAFEKSMELAREASARALEIYNLVKLGECAYLQNRLEQALKFASQARQIATETGLAFEKGLASALQARIYVSEKAYGTSYTLFADALASFTENDIIEQVKVRLWWGNALLLDMRARAAFEQLQKTIHLILAREELLPGLESILAETRHFLLHFRHRADTPPAVRDNIRKLLGPRRNWAAASEPGVQVFSFGPASLIVADEFKHFFSQRGKVRRMPEFLLYLILAGEQGSRWSEVCTAIWPELDAERASLNFHQTLRRLRESILAGHDYILIRDDYYLFDRNYLKWCDALTFNTLFERAATVSPGDALDLQLEIIALYQGEFLTGFELEEWGLTHRRRCESQFLQTVSLTSKQLLDLNSPRQALTIIQKGLDHDYFREDLHRSAARAYVQLGLYADLADHYHNLCRVFETELGGPPAPETQQAFRQGEGSS